MKKTHVVKRLENMGADDPRRRVIADSGLPADVPCLATTKVCGPMTKWEAQRMGEEIADQGGCADIFDEKRGELVATVRWGELFLPDQRNEKGERLFFDYANCFWTGVSRT